MREGRSSLVDVAEDALRRWLATGRHRSGERLPPEQELSGRLGISRGTLRTALRRLEESGEIVRRQGSGTFVGQSTSWSLDEGLERLVSYTELARRQGITLRLGLLEVEQLPLASEQAELFGVEAGTPATTITRVVLLDVLLKAGIPVAYNRLHIVARVLGGGDPIGKALGVSDATAALEIEHVTCTADGSPVEQSVDTFLPSSIDLHVVRWREDVPPVPAIDRRSRE
jgi:GntR family transcriptional regulator